MQFMWSRALSHSAIDPSVWIYCRLWSLTDEVEVRQELIYLHLEQYRATLCLSAHDPGFGQAFSDNAHR